MSIKLKYLYYIGLILLFFPSCVIFLIPQTNANIQLSSIWGSILILGLVFFHTNLIKKHISNLLKIKVFKIYLYFISFLLLTSFTHMFLGFYKATTNYYFARFLKFFFFISVLYVFPSLGVLFKIKLNNIIKIFYTMIYVLLIISFLQYISLIFQIDILYYLIQIFASETFNASEVTMTDIAFDQKRIYGIFREPSVLGQFVFITLPFIFEISKTKYRLFNIRFLNLFYKKTVLILALFVLVFTKSPIYLVLCSLELVILILYSYRKITIKYWYLFAATLLTIVICIASFILSKQDMFENTYLLRIIKTMSVFSDFSLFAIVEPNLASRIISYQNQCRVFLDNFFTGIGYFNVTSVISEYYKTSNLFLTKEIVIGCHTSPKFIAFVARNTVATLLAEIGLIGFSLYAYWQYCNFKALNFIQNKLRGLDRIFVYALFQSFIMISIISFYNLSIDHSPLVFLFFGISLYVIVYYKFVFTRSFKCQKYQ